MSKDFWFNCYQSKFLQATRDMTIEQQGFFGQIVFRIAESGQPVRAEDRIVARWCKSNARAWRRIKGELLDGGHIYIAPCGGLLPVHDDLLESTRRIPVSAKLRLAIFERDSWTCIYCGTKEGPFHVDHILPVSKGGDNAEDNLCCACVLCNCSKGNKFLHQWEGAK